MRSLTNKLQEVTSPDYLLKSKRDTTTMASDAKTSKKRQPFSGATSLAKISNGRQGSMPGLSASSNEQMFRAKRGRSGEKEGSQADGKGSHKQGKPANVFSSLFPQQVLAPPQGLFQQPVNLNINFNTTNISMNK